MLKLTAKRTRWFPVPQDPSGETQIEILHLKPGEVSDIEAQSNQITGKQLGGGDTDFVTEIDFKLNERSKKFVMRAVVGWKGFADIKGKPLKCSDITKAQVLKEFGWFSEFVEQCRKELAEEVASEEEEAEKN